MPIFISTHYYSLDNQCYTKCLQLKSTDSNAQNVICKIINYFSQPVQGARHTT